MKSISYGEINLFFSNKASCNILLHSASFAVTDTPSCQCADSLHALRQNTCQVCGSHTLLTSKCGSVYESTTLHKRSGLPLSSLSYIKTRFEFISTDRLAKGS